MFVTYRQGNVVPFENGYGERQIVVTSGGKVAVFGNSVDGDSREGWWVQTATDYEQGGPGVSMEELRGRIAKVRQALRTPELPNDGITALALAMAALDSLSSEFFNAVEFHKGVVALAPLVLANTERRTTTVYDTDGACLCDVSLDAIDRREDSVEVAV